MSAVDVEHREVLRRHGIVVTAQRLAVMRAVAAHPHATAGEIGRSVRDEIGAMSRQAVYDALEVLVDAALVRQFRPAGAAARFEARVGDDHQHAVCRSCGLVVDVDATMALGGTVDLEGFEIEVVETTYWGRCPQCIAEDAHHHRRSSELRSPQEDHRHVRHQQRS